MRPESPRRRGRRLNVTYWWLGGALFLPFAIVLVVIGQAISGESGRRSVEARVLADYASVAVNELAKHAAAALHMQETARAFHPVAHNSGTDSAGRRAARRSVSPDPGALLGSWRDSTTIGRMATTAFRYSVDSARLTFSGTPIESEMLAELQLRLAALSADTSGEPHHILLGKEAKEVIWLGADRDMDMMGPGRRPRAIYGLITPAAALGKVIAGVLDERPILPSGLLAPPYDASALSVSVRSPSNVLLWSNGGDTTLSAPGVDTLPAYLSGAVLEVHSGARVASVLRIGRPSGLYVPVLFTLLALSLAMGILGMIQLRRAREVADLRERFVANVSHELRTPLTQMSMFAEMLQQSRVRSEGEARHYASVIHRETRRLTALVESVLRFSRGRRGAVAVHVEDCDIAAEIADAVEFFAPVAAGKGVSIEVQSAPSALVRIDPSAFRQVLLNLLDNAVKYGPEGQRVSITATVQGGDVVVTVADQGMGIAPENRERVFEPYVRLDSADARRVAGAGIGLAVVRDLVAAQGGRVWVEGADGGAAIRFTAPLCNPDMIDAPLVGAHAAR